MLFNVGTLQAAAQLWVQLTAATGYHAFGGESKRGHLMACFTYRMAGSPYPTDALHGYTVPRSKKFARQPSDRRRILIECELSSLPESVS